MANLGTVIDTNVVAPAEERGAFPAGEYLVTATESEVKPNAKGTGLIAKFRFQVVEGPSKGRLVFANMNFQHENPTAQEIGQGELSALSKACGITKLSDTSQTHGKVIKVKVGLEKDQNGADRNVIKSYLWKASQVNGNGAVASVGAISSDDIPF